MYKENKKGKRVVCFPNKNSICVDGSCIKGKFDQRGVMEWRGVEVRTGKEIFRFGPFPNGDSNIAEYMALVEGIRYIKRRKIKRQIYSDNYTAINGVLNKLFPIPDFIEDEHILNLLMEADKFIQGINLDRYKIRKWITKGWGENRADFGYKRKQYEI